MSTTDISTTLTKWQGSLKDYALSAYDSNVFIKSANLAIMQSKELQECFKTQDGLSSLFQAMRFASSTGLSLNPQEGKAALIAYKGKAQYQIMKNGMMELAERSGKVKTISSDTVREKDEFSIEKTSDGDKYSFKPARKDRGEIDGFFASIVLKDGTCHVKYMTVQEAEVFRNSYSSLYKNRPDASPWKKSFEGMGLKTVMKALLRNISISPEVAQVIGADDQSEPAEPPMKDITPKKDMAEEIAAQIEEKEKNDDDQPMFPEKD